MKKGLIYALVFALGAVLWTACSDEDDPLFKPEELNKEYGSSKTAALTLTYGNAPLTGKKVTFNTENSKTATITLTDVIPGEEQTTINNILLKEEKGKYVFSGQTTGVRAAGTTIDYDGSIADTVLNLNLNVTLADPQGWAKTYRPSEITQGMALTCIIEGIELLKEEQLQNITSACYAMSNMRLRQLADFGGDFGQFAPYAGVAGNLGNIHIIARNMLGGVLPQVLKTVNLKADGNITAQYSSDPVTFNFQWFFPDNAPTSDTIAKYTTGRHWINESPKNLAYWFQKDGKLYVKLNVAAIVAQVLSDGGQGEGNEIITSIVNAILNGNTSTINDMIYRFLGIRLKEATINTLLEWLKHGIPLNMATENGHTHIYLDRETLSPFIDDLPAFIPLIKSKNPMGQGETLAAIIEFFCEYWTDYEQFDIGLDLIQ